LEHIIEGKIEGTGRRRRTHTQLLDDLNETRGYWKLEEEEQTAFWRTRFGKSNGLVVIRQTK